MKKTKLRINGKIYEGLLIEKNYVLTSLKDLIEGKSLELDTQKELLDLKSLFILTHNGDFPTNDNPLVVNMARFITHNETLVIGNTSRFRNKVRIPSKMNGEIWGATEESDAYFLSFLHLKDKLMLIEDAKERAKTLKDEKERALEDDYTMFEMEEDKDDTLILKYETFQARRNAISIGAAEAVRVILEAQNKTAQPTTPTTLSTGRIKGRLYLISKPENRKPAKFRFGDKQYIVPSGKAWDWVENVILQNGFEGHPVEANSPSPHFKREARDFFKELIKPVENKLWYIKTN